MQLPPSVLKRRIENKDEEANSIVSNGLGKDARSFLTEAFDAVERVPKNVLPLIKYGKVQWAERIMMCMNDGWNAVQSVIEG